MQNRRHFRMLFRIMLPAVFILLLSLTAFAGSETYSVRYGKIVDGSFVNSYSKWNTTVEGGKKLKTVAMKDKNGKRCWWRVRGNDGNTALIRSGESFTVKGNARLTPVWRKIYTIRFYNKSGTKEYTSKKMTFCRDERLQLPTLKVSSIYQFSGWSRKKGSSAADYTCTKKYTMTSDLNLYAAVHKRQWYTVRFWSQAAGSEYTQLNSAVLEGGTLTLPKLSDTSAYRFLGWSYTPKQTQTSLTAGTVITVTKNIKLYAVFAVKSGPKVYLKNFDGSTYMLLIPDGKTIRFPSVSLGKKKTLQGWSTTKGKTNSPEYLEGQIIPAKAAVYYMVVAATANSGVTLKESSSYSQVYFVGDSRMQHCSLQFGSKLKKTKFIAESSSGYDWLAVKGTGYASLVKTIKADNKKISGRKAVIFCHGVNDMGNISLYINFYKSKAKELQSLGCRLYVMSVNPFCAKQRQWYRVTHGDSEYQEKRTQEQRETFNRRLKTDLKGTYTYLDVSSYLVKTGWPTCSADSEAVADGLHYSTDTNKKIINRAEALIDLN